MNVVASVVVYRDRALEQLSEGLYSEWTIAL
jgi:hypothetical protein